MDSSLRTDARGPASGSGQLEASAVLRGPLVYLVGAATILIFGFNWPIMARGDRAMAAMWLAAFRLVGAALVVFVVVAARGSLSKVNRHDVPIVLSVGLFRIALVNGLVFSALRFVPPGHATFVAFTASLWTLPIAAVWLGERLTRWRVGGVVLGCIGLGLLLEPWALDWSDTGTLVGLGLLLAAALASASTSVHIRGHRWRATPLELLPWQLMVAAVPTVALALALEGPPEMHWSAMVVGIIAFQVLPASSFAMWGELTVCRSLPAISANLFLMAIPVIGLGASILFGEDTITLAAGVGCALILSGVAGGLLLGQRDVDMI
jgi:drug/metabolite transporter (DMT)-like permease